MIFAKNLYLGEKAKKEKNAIIKKLKKGRAMLGVYVITPAACEKDLLDIYPSFMLREKYLKDLKVIGLAVSKNEAYEVCMDIVNDAFEKTGSYSIRALL